MALKTVGFGDPLEILRNYDLARTADQLIGPFARYLTQFGLSNMLISGLPAADIRQWQRSILDNHWRKGWYDRYVAREHYRFDPCVKLCRETEVPFLWSEIPATELGPQQRLVLNEASDFGMQDGFCVPIHGPVGPPAVVTLSGERVELGREERHIVEMLSRTLVRAIARLTGHPVQARRILTKREIEVAQLIAEGNSAAQVARILFISRHTVERHLLNIRSKLSCSSTTEAIVKAIRMHLIY